MIKYLYDEIAKRWYRGGSIYFIGDPHFGDGNIYNKRFPHACDFSGDLTKCTRLPLTIKELDEWQVKRINSKVGKNDTIVFLGDIGDLEYIKKIRGYKVLIMGNHDKGASNYKKSKVKSCPECGSLNLTRDFSDILNHCYTCSDCHGRFNDNYFKEVSNNLFDEVYEGPLMINDKIILSHEPIEIPKYLFNIHGHIHSTQYREDENHLNCCGEAINYIPINLNNLIKKGLLKDTKSIHRNTIDKNLLLKK